MIGANGQIMWLENINGRFRLANSAWTAELFSVDLAPRTTVVAAINLPKSPYSGANEAFPCRMLRNGAMNIVSQVMVSLGYMVQERIEKQHGFEAHLGRRDGSVSFYERF